MIRPSDGLPASYKNFPTHREAIYFPDKVKKKHNFADLIDRYLEFYLIYKPKNAKDTVRHLNWWKTKLEKY
jgi:hypothetical protein